MKNNGVTLADIFGNDNTIDKSKFKGVEDKMVSNGNTLELSPELSKILSNPVTREEFKEKIRREERKANGLDELYNDSYGTGMGPIFTPDQVWVKTKVAHDKYKSGEDTLDDVNLTDEMRSSVEMIKKSKYRGLISDRLINGLNSSIKSITMDEEEYRRFTQSKFLQWLMSQNIDLKKLDEASQYRLYQQWIQTKRLRIDTLIREALKLVDSVFIKTMEYEFEQTGLTFTVDHVRALKDVTTRRNMIRGYIHDNGGRPFMKVEEFTILKYFFGKYGFDPKDRYFFEEGAKASDGRKMSELFEEFKELTTYNFLDLYSHYLNEWRADRSKNYDYNNIDNNDTEEVTEEFFEEDEIIIEE